MQIPLTETRAGDTPSPSIRIYSDADLTPANGVTRGSGTASDPYVIEDLLITGPELRCIEIKNTRKHLLVRNVTCAKGSGGSMGIQVGNATNITFEDNTVIDLPYGISLYECQGITVRNHTATSGNIKMNLCKDVEVINSSVTDVVPKFHSIGIEVLFTENCLIRECNVVNVSNYGVQIWASDNVSIQSTRIEEVGRDGIYVRRVNGTRSGISLSGNEISDCRYGILLMEVSDVTVVDNTIRGNSMVGLLSQFSTMLNCSGNEMERYGIILDVDEPDQAMMEFHSNTISGRPIVYMSDDEDRVIETDAAQVFLVNMTDSRLVNYTDTAALNPVYVFYCNNVTLSNCDLADGLRGITVMGGRRVSVQASSLVNYTDKGIAASLTTNLTISNSTFADSRYCIEVLDSDVVNVLGNSFSNSTRGVMGDDESPTGETQDKWTIANNSLLDLVYGIRVYDLTNGSVKNNVIDGCEFSAIQVLDPNVNLTVEGNVISNCSWAGIGIGPSVSSRISNNTIRYCEIIGIGIGSLEDGLLWGNSLSFCGGMGIEVGTATDSEIVGNFIYRCEGLALELDGSGNLVHLNSFISNSLGEPGPYPDQVLDVGSGEAWDDGSRGNYWSDYRAKHPAAGNDGIVWDTPYRINTSSASSLFDRYPLAIEPDLVRPVARAGGDLVVDEGTTVTLDGSGSSDDKGIVSFRWTFQYGGRGVVLSSPVYDYEFGIPGTYDITLNVSDRFGNWDVDTRRVTVRDVLAPLADAGRDQEVDQFTTAVLDGGASYDSGGIANHTWSMEMGGETLLFHGAIVEVPCDIAGVFTVTLTVTDNVGRTGTDTMTLTVRDREPPVPVIEERVEATMGVPFAFDGSASTDDVGIVGYEWVFEYNDTTHTLTGPSPSFTFHVLGVYYVILRVIDAADNEGEAIMEVVVLDRQAPVFLHDWVERTQRVETVRIVVEFNWTVWSDDDGSFPGGANLTYVLSRDGETFTGHGAFANISLPEGGAYDVSLTATDASGNRAVYDYSLVVDWHPGDAAPPVAHAGEDLVVHVGDEVHLNGTYTRGDLGVEVTMWRVADDPDQSWPGADHTFTAAGVTETEYVFSVQDWMGNKANDSMVVTVLPRKPVLEVLTDLGEPLTGHVTVEGTSSGDVPIERVECRVDGGDWELAEGTGTWSFDIIAEDLQDGNHTLEVRAWDGYDHGTAGPLVFTVSNEVPNGDGEPGGGGESSMYLMIAAVVVVVVIIGAVVLIRRSRG